MDFVLHKFEHCINSSEQTWEDAIDDDAVLRLTTLKFDVALCRLYSSI